MNINTYSLIIVFFLGFSVFLPKSDAQDCPDLALTSSIDLDSERINADGNIVYDFTLTLTNNSPFEVQEVLMQAYYHYNLGMPNPAFEIDGDDFEAPFPADLAYFFYPDQFLYETSSNNETDVDDVVIIIGDNLQPPSTKNLDRQCDRAIITGKLDKSMGVLIQLFNLPANDVVTMNARVIVNKNTTACALAVASEIIAATDCTIYDLSGSNEVPILDDNVDGNIDPISEKFTYFTFDVCQFPDENQCALLVPPGSQWTVMLDGDTYNFTGDETNTLYNTAPIFEDKNPIPNSLPVTIQNNLGCSGTFDINYNPTLNCGPDPIVLPIELLYFEGKQEKQSIRLSWATATELNNEAMYVQRSKDGKTFEDIGKVQGSGTSLEQQHYEFIDANPLRGTNYYRLRQVDTDGKTELHDVIAVDFQVAGQIISLYPTVAKDELILEWSTDRQQRRIVIFDWSGKKHLEIELNSRKSETIDISNLDTGMYFLKADEAGVVGRFMKF